MDTNNKNEYVLLTDDLSTRIDFYNKNRFSYYKDCVFTNQISPQQPNEIPDDNDIIPDNSIDKLIRKDGDGYVPIFENVEPPLDEDILKPKISIGKLLKLNKIEFALLSIDNYTEYFRDVIKGGIPFAFISPDGSKCEWFKLNEKFMLPAYKCVDCEERRCENKKCDLHSMFNGKTEAETSVSKFQKSISDILNSNILKEVPIFEFSTGIDLIRWYYFYKKYCLTQVLQNQSNTGKTENFLEAIVKSLIQDYLNKQDSIKSPTKED